MSETNTMHENILFHFLGTNILFILVIGDANKTDIHLASFCCLVREIQSKAIRGQKSLISHGPYLQIVTCAIQMQTQCWEGP